MNYYPFHVGDYASHTAHLEPMEDLAYRRLLDVYYLREGPLPADIQATAKLVRMRSMAADVESVLREFFTLTDAGWVHDRCNREIEAMREKQDKQRQKANRRWDMQRAAHGTAPAMPRHDDTDAAASKTDADAMPPTPTPTPTPTPVEKKEARKRAAPLAPPPDVDPQVWDDWLQLRRNKRAPVTCTVVAEAQREAVKAGMTLEAFLRIWCSRGSQGLQADWLRPNERGGGVVPINRQEALEARNRAVGDAWLRDQEAINATG